MKNVALLLDDIAPVDDIPKVDRIISLSPPADTRIDSLEVIDGEQTYALYDLTEQADNLAMEWARAAYLTLAASAWASLFTHYGIDLKPLIINRLFRGFFLNPARIYLSVKRISAYENNAKITILASARVDALFAQAACVAAGVEVLPIHLPTVDHRRFRFPKALQIFARDIAAPALRHPFFSPMGTRLGANMKRIVFFERHGMAIEMAASAFDALLRKYDAAITIVHLGPERAKATYTGAHYVDWNDYQNLRTLLRLLKFQTRITAQKKTNCDWPEPVLSHVTSHIEQFVRRVALPSIHFTLETTRRIIQVERPNLLITVDETGLLGKAVAMEGRRSGVPTLNIQHGVRADSPWIEDQLFDRFAVFGPSSSEIFVNRGNDPDTFIPTGAPRYDRLFRRHNLKAPEQVATELGLEPDRPVILFVSQRAWGRMTPVIKRETLITLLRTVNQTDAQLVVKLRDDHQDYVPPQATREPGWEFVKVTANYDLYDLLNASDLVVTAYSTVGMEAVALGKPLLIINLTGQPDPIPFVEEGVAIGAYQADQVNQAIETILSQESQLPERDQRRHDFIHRHLTSDDGCSAERLAQLMLDMMQVQ